MNPDLIKFLIGLAIGLMAGSTIMLTVWRRRFPAVVPAMLGMLVAWLTLGHPDTTSLISWAVTAAICVILYYLDRHSDEVAAPERYAAVGALVGALLGAVAHTQAAVIVASVVGAILGALAFRMTLAARNSSVSMIEYLQMLAPTALQAVASFSMLAILI